MIWYCHLLSTSRFHRHLTDHGRTNLGLDHSHFPFAELVALVRRQKWTNDYARSAWDRYNKGRGALPYQLWRQAPWKGAGKTQRRPSVVSRLFRRSSSGLAGPASSDPAAAADGQYGYSHEPSVRQYREPRVGCALVARRHADLPPCWSLRDYAAWRLGQRDGQCRAYDDHLDAGENCELSPFPSIGDLSVALHGQVAFWAALAHARDARPDFLAGIKAADADYARFMSLFRRRNGGTVDAPEWENLEAMRLVPPTLEIDLLWHTHRLFPGSYWRWCVAEVGQLVEHTCLPYRDYVKDRLEATKARWDSLGMADQKPDAANEVTDWMDMYIPGVAVLAQEDALKGTLEMALKGREPWKQRQKPTPPYSGTSSAKGKGASKSKSHGFSRGHKSSRGHGFFFNVFIIAISVNVAAGRA